jgi:hypothetical protein
MTQKINFTKAFYFFILSGTSSFPNYYFTTEFISVVFFILRFSEKYDKIQVVIKKGDFV